jgi:nucleoside-diphosphate-sugar epimerase
VVYYCTQPPYTRWAEEFLAMTNAVLAGAKGAKIVFADNLYLYGPVAGALTEDLPSRATGRKGRVRAAVAKRLLIAHRSGEVRVTIGRASDYYGPGGLNSAVGERLFEPILEGGRASWLGRADAPHTLHYLEDIARGLVTLGERREADGEVWHLPAAPALTGRDFVDLIAETVGRPVRMRTTSSGMVRFAGIFSPFVREVRETMYQWQNPFVIDSSKFEHAFGPAKTTNHREAVARTVDWFKQELARAGRSSPK